MCTALPNCLLQQLDFMNPSLWTLITGSLNAALWVLLGGYNVKRCCDLTHYNTQILSLDPLKFVLLPSSGSTALPIKSKIPMKECLHACWLNSFHLSLLFVSSCSHLLSVLNTSSTELNLLENLRCTYCEEAIYVIVLLVQLWSLFDCKFIEGLNSPYILLKNGKASC